MSVTNTKIESLLRRLHQKGIITERDVAQNCSVIETKQIEQRLAENHGILTPSAWQEKTGIDPRTLKPVKRRWI